MSSNAKLAYMLSVCHKLNDGIMTVMSKQYAKSKTVATRHYFSLRVNLYEIPNTDQFAVKNVQSVFANSTDKILLEALQYHNADILTDDEMKLIYQQLLEQGITLDVYQVVAIYSIATLIKIYYKKGFKYIFIPIVINYGRNSCLLHQTALIIDISNDQYKMIYYEPYGKYVKYNHSYKNAINKLLQCFKGFMCFVNDVPYITYHELLNIPDGIQNILLTKNNLRVNDFNKKYDEIVKTLKDEFSYTEVKDAGEDPSSIDTDDKTIAILDLIFNVDYFDIDKLSIEKTKIYYDVLNTILSHYCCFNSKTCVSITIIEMNKFFMFSQESNHDILNIKTKIHQMYELYNTSVPNTVLMTEIYSLIDLLKYSKKIHELLNDRKQINVICDNL